MAESKERGEPATVLSRWATVKIFAYGIIACMVCSRAVRLSQKWWLPSISKIQASTLPMLRANHEIRQQVGSSLRPGLLSAHTYTGGLRWKLPRLSQPFSLRNALPIHHEPWAVRMLFQVVGEHSTALVALETQPNSLSVGGGVLRYKFLTVDFDSGERLVLKGRAEHARQMEFPKLHLSDS